MPAPRTHCSIGNQRKTVEVDGEVVTEIYTKRYDTGDDVLANLRFALKHEAIDLAVIVGTLKAIDPSLIIAWVTSEPRSVHSRQSWFLYETFVAPLDLPDAKVGTYVEILDPDRHITAARRISARHRVYDNLLGGRALCPMVRRSPKLVAQLASSLRGDAATIANGCDPALMLRAVNYLYTKETRASFAIEGEVPSANRTQRFMAALQDVGSFVPDPASLIALQRKIVDPRYAASGWRDFQNFVGGHLRDGSDRVDYLCPKPTDVEDLMTGWGKLVRRVSTEPVDAVVAAAVASFAFVFIHPFEDGNGRIHRFLIHHLLTLKDFVPDGFGLPVSAAILRDKRGYDHVLEAFSRPRLLLTQWHWQPDKTVVIDSDNVDLYRYFDATPMVEFLYDRVAASIHEDLKEELAYLADFDRSCRLAREVVDMPDKKMSLFVRLCMDNHGQLSSKKRHLFAEISDQEVAALEAAIAPKTMD